jgi:diadenosine tetraphosphate (Ap4A) HIT family hydrolase
MPESLAKFKEGLLNSLGPVEHSRFRYVRRRQQHPYLHPECRFCQRIQARKDILFENQHIVVMFGRQHHKGHLVVMPKAHEEDLMKLHRKTLASFMNDTIKIMSALGKAIRPDLFNLEYLDNWDHHVHWNVYPRFRSDPDWGSPPRIPGRNSKFRPRMLSKKELSVFRKELKNLKKRLW